MLYWRLYFVLHFLLSGAIVHVVDLHLHVVVAPHLVEEATAGHHLLTVLVRSCLMLMGKSLICYLC